EAPSDFKFPSSPPLAIPPRLCCDLSGCGGGAPGWGRGEGWASATRGVGTAPAPPTPAAPSGLRRSLTAAAPGSAAVARVDAPSAPRRTGPAPWRAGERAAAPGRHRG
ncbi:hypothetical protein P7K49_009560, partial [Saguinus oedipus]